MHSELIRIKKATKPINSKFFIDSHRKKKRKNRRRIHSDALLAPRCHKNRVLAGIPPTVRGCIFPFYDPMQFYRVSCICITLPLPPSSLAWSPLHLILPSFHPRISTQNRRAKRFTFFFFFHSSNVLERDTISCRPERVKHNVLAHYANEQKSPILYLPIKRP